MIDLIFTILCSTSIAVILKINSIQKGNLILLLTGNYFSASVLGYILFIGDINSTSPNELIPMGILLSLFFVGSIFAFSKSIELSGAAISTVSSRLSVFVPILLSMIIYAELPNVYQSVGLLFTVLTILIFYFSIGDKIRIKQSNRKFLYLLSVLIGIGIADFFMKVFQENWSASDKPWFLFWIFFFSFIITLIIFIKRKGQVEIKTLLLGIFMGVPNIFSSYFLIESLKLFSAVFVYPVVNISIILFTSIIVRIVWKESWNLLSKIALLLGIISIGLLSL